MSEEDAISLDVSELLDLIGDLLAELRTRIDHDA